MRASRWLVVGMASALVGAVPAAGAAGQGHGPIYGLSTPTLGRGGWSLDVGWMGRLLDGARLLMARPMLSYGVTEDVQIYGSVPLSIDRDASVPAVRGFTRMPATRDVEVGLGWRMQRRGVGVGSRQETTVWAAVAQPLGATRGDLPTSPGGFAAVVTGWASRTVYAWAGAAYRRYLGRDGSRPGDSGMGSLVVGYRPAPFREDYPHPDWRGFVEIVGEWVGRDVLDGRPVPDTGGRQSFVALTLLGLYGSWGIAGGPAFPLAEDVAGAAPEERMRLAVNITFWW